MLDVANISARMVGEDDVYAPTVRARQIRRSTAPAFEPAVDSDDEVEVEEGAAEAAPEAASAGSSSGSPSGVNDPPPLAVGAAVQAVVVDITGDSAPDNGSEDSGDGQVPLWRPQFVSPPLPAQRRTPPATR